MEAQDKEVLDRGLQLSSLQGSEGWKLVQGYLKDSVVEANEALLNYMGTDPNVIKSMQLSARCTKEVMEGIQQFINEGVSSARMILMEEQERAQND